MNSQRGSWVRRRAFLTSAARLGRVSAAGLTGCTGSGSGRPAAPGRGFADAVLAALAAHRVVALGAADSLQNHYDVLRLLLADPRLPRGGRRHHRRVGQPPCTRT